MQLVFAKYKIQPSKIAKLSSDKAKKEYKENRRKFNKNESAVEGAENAEAYAMSEGLASVENLKALRQKQLGLIS